MGLLQNGFCFTAHTGSNSGIRVLLVLTICQNRIPNQQESTYTCTVLGMFQRINHLSRSCSRDSFQLGGCHLWILAVSTGRIGETAVSPGRSVEGRQWLAEDGRLTKFTGRIQAVTTITYTVPCHLAKVGTLVCPYTFIRLR